MAALKKKAQKAFRIFVKHKSSSIFSFSHPNIEWGGSIHQGGDVAIQLVSGFRAVGIVDAERRHQVEFMRDGKMRRVADGEAKLLLMTTLHTFNARKPLEEA